MIKRASARYLALFTVGRDILLILCRFKREKDFNRLSGEKKAASVGSLQLPESVILCKSLVKSENFTGKFQCGNNGAN